MKYSKDSNIGQAVADDYKTASVFKAFKIDFCCNGDRTIAQACKNKDIDANKVVDALQQCDSQKDSSDNIDYRAWPADLLIDYIVKIHHKYVREKIPSLVQFVTKIKNVHGDRHPELNEIHTLFIGSCEDLLQHLDKEEQVLFPYIKNMDSGEYSRPSFDTIQNPIMMLSQEHTHEGDRFRKIRELSNDYTPPADACITYKVTFSMLEEFESDLHKHIHLENNILFAKAIELESQLVG